MLHFGLEPKFSFKAALGYDNIFPKNKDNKLLNLLEFTRITGYSPGFSSLEFTDKRSENTPSALFYPAKLVKIDYNNPYFDDLKSFFPNADLESSYPEITIIDEEDIEYAGLYTQEYDSVKLNVHHTEEQHLGFGSEERDLKPVSNLIHELCHGLTYKRFPNLFSNRPSISLHLGKDTLELDTKNILEIIAHGIQTLIVPQTKIQDFIDDQPFESYVGFQKILVHILNLMAQDKTMEFTPQNIGIFKNNIRKFLQSLFASLDRLEKKNAKIPN